MNSSSMHVFHSLPEVPQDFGRTVISIGNFDGVHCGHRYVLDHVREQARESGARSVAVTFEPHPTRVLRPSAGLKLITPHERRIELLAQTGIDALLILPFTPELSRLTAFEFASEIMHSGLRTTEVHEGENFRFGYRAEGNVSGLGKLGHELGFTAHIYNARHIHGMRVSSTKIRELLAAGDVRRARWLLGRPFSVVSSPAKGRGIGARLTVPTINLAEYDELLPANGVYVTRMQVDDQHFDAVTNVGMRPTFENAAFGVETHLLNFQPMELSATTRLELTFLTRIRDEIVWPSPEALKAQIGRDVTHAQRYLRLWKRISH